MKIHRSILFVVLVYLVGVGCSGGSTDSDPGENNEIKRFSLIAKSNPTEGGTVSPSSGTYEEGTTINIKAEASVGWEFTGWEGDYTSTNNPASFTIAKNMNITGNFIDSGDSNEKQRFSLTATGTPAEGGTVSPTSGTFDEGTTVTVQAEANEGWAFTGWEGDVASADNPLSFPIAKNTSIEGTFNATSSIYQVTLTLRDASNSLQLEFGQGIDASDNCDNGMDVESPPNPPAGVLHGYFKSQEKHLFKDFRNFKEQNITWTFFYQVGEGDSLELSWEIVETRLEGSLELLVEETSAPVDMLSTQHYKFKSMADDSIIIKYRYIL